MKIKKIMIKRIEGLEEETTYKTLEDADNKLVGISLTAPKYGGYDKTEVYTTFEDDSTIVCRHDIEFGNIDNSIIEHIRIVYDNILNNPTRYPKDIVCKSSKILLKISEYL